MKQPTNTPEWVAEFDKNFKHTCGDENGNGDIGQDLLQSVNEWVEENKHVMANVVGVKRVETPWVNADDLQSFLKTKGMQK